MPIIAALTLAAQLLPEITALVPVVERAIAGEDMSEADLQQIAAVTDALNAQIAAAVQANASA